MKCKAAHAPVGMKNIVGVSDTGGIERVVAGRVSRFESYQK
jgi:hypothetical protein